MFMPYGSADGADLVTKAGGGNKKVAAMLAPYGSADHRSLVAKEGGVKGGTALLMPFGEPDYADLVAKAGNMKMGQGLALYGLDANVSLVAKADSKSGRCGTGGARRVVRLNAKS
jgi:hypothetical protein